MEINLIVLFDITNYIKSINYHDSVIFESYLDDCMPCLVTKSDLSPCSLHLSLN